MVVWSSIFRSVAQPKQIFQLSKLNTILSAPKNGIICQVRKMSDHGPRLMPIQPSRFQWNKFKDQLHFYAMLGLIPGLIGVFLVNVFVGPATLSKVPDGYEPKHWEYFNHPITRFLARYIYANPQQDYEKMLHFLYEENEQIQLRKLERKIKNLMRERQDFQAYYYRPVTTKYLKVSKEAADYLESIWGN